MLCRFWPIKLCNLLHIIQFVPFLGWGERVRWREFTSIIPCNEWIQDSIQIKETLTFLCLSSPANIGGSNFLLKAKMSMCFIFWVWMAEFWIWLIWKLAEKAKMYIFVESFSLETPSTTLELWSRSISP